MTCSQHAQVDWHISRATASVLAAQQCSQKHQKHVDHIPSCAPTDNNRIFASFDRHMLAARSGHAAALPLATFCAFSFHCPRPRKTSENWWLSRTPRFQPITRLGLNIVKGWSSSSRKTSHHIAETTHAAWPLSPPLDPRCTACSLKHQNQEGHGSYRRTAGISGHEVPATSSPLGVRLAAQETQLICSTALLLCRAEPGRWAAIHLHVVVGQQHRNQNWRLRRPLRSKACNIYF